MCFLFPVSCFFPLCNRFINNCISCYIFLVLFKIRFLSPVISNKKPDKKQRNIKCKACSAMCFFLFLAFFCYFLHLVFLLFIARFFVLYCPKWKLTSKETRNYVAKNTIVDKMVAKEKKAKSKKQEIGRMDWNGLKWIQIFKNTDSWMLKWILFNPECIFIHL